MRFSELIGQKMVIQSLQNSIKNKRISHAYIFEGPEGIGKMTMADIFSASLTCETGDIEPCGICRSCIKNKNHNHPDVKIIGSNENSLGIDTIREMQRDIHIKPYEASKKIYIIPQAEKMTIQAQNGVLKSLEEPPPYAIIIMTAVNSALLLETILSRSILIRFNRLSYTEVEEYLKKRFPQRGDEIPFITSFSGGIIGRANAIAESKDFNKTRKDIIEIASTLINEDELTTINTAKYFIEHKNDIHMILELLLLWFRDILLMKELYNDNMIINIDMMDRLNGDIQKIPSFAVCRIIDRIIDTKKKISMNANYTLAIESMLIQSWEEIHGRCSRGAI